MENYCEDIFLYCHCRWKLIKDGQQSGQSHITAQKHEQKIIVIRFILGLSAVKGASAILLFSIIANKCVPSYFILFRCKWFTFVLPGQQFLRKPFSICLSGVSFTDCSSAFWVSFFLPQSRLCRECTWQLLQKFPSFVKTKNVPMKIYCIPKLRLRPKLWEYIIPRCLLLLRRAQVYHRGDQSRAANEPSAKISKSPPGWMLLLALSHLRHYAKQAPKHGK